MIRPEWQIMNDHKPNCIEEILEILLANRCAGPTFLTGSLKDLEPHLAIQGLREGAELMAWHLARRHKVVLVGDYDCDGVTSAAQLSLFLRDIGYCGHVVVIPHRSEGYGVPERAICEHPDARLLVALDCGTLDTQPINLARSLGIDTIVIDHHEAPVNGLAPANVLINPKQQSCPSTFKEFSAAGLTLLFLAALRRAIRQIFPQPSLGTKYLALATIGTVADIVPLTDANRILTKAGLSHLARNDFLPIQRMIEAAGLSGKAVTAGHIGYYLGPRINVAGRLASAHMAFDLLTEEDPKRIGELARELNRLNTKRQHEEELILKEVAHRYAESPAGSRTLVMSDPGWPAGIIGIVASRIQQQLHYGPTILLSADEKKGIARGSARSVPGFDIHAALKACDRHLLRSGGHKMAAGLTISIHKMEKFIEEFEQVAQQYPQEVFIPRGKVDMELNPEWASLELLDALKQLEPHGPGNPRPTFAARKVKLRALKTFGKNQEHLRILLQDRIPGVFWRGRDWYERQSGEQADVIFQLEWDDFIKKPALNIKDIGHFFFGS